MQRRIRPHAVARRRLLDWARGQPGIFLARELKGKMKQFWLVKQEPTAYSWDDFVRDGGTSWTGVRNFSARNFLRAMKVGDEVLYYHSVIGKEVVGIATVARSAYPDTTAKEGDWSAVDLTPLRPLRKPVTLETIKGDPRFRDLPLLRQSRLSVQPLTKTEFRDLVALGK